MMRPRLPCAALVLAAALLPASAIASSFVGTTANSASDGASASSKSSSGNDKIVLQAREDAAGFVASEGRIRSARLEAALHHLRNHSPRDDVRQASDMTLAKAILAL